MEIAELVRCAMDESRRWGRPRWCNAINESYRIETADRSRRESPESRPLSTYEPNLAIPQFDGARTECRGFFRIERFESIMQGNLPPEAQEKIEELQDLQETAQTVAQQKQQAETTLQESKTALQTLEEIDDQDTMMYREVGELLVETDYDEANQELEQKVDSLEVRVETLKKQEERVQEQFESLQQELQQMLQGAGGGPMGPGGPGAGGA